MTDGNERLQIVLWKWRNPRKLHILFDYSADAVNRKRQELQKFLRIPHDVVCITDDPHGIDSAIRVLPLWPDAVELGGCWRRLRAFAPDMHDLIGPRFAWIDLDSLVVGTMDSVLSRPEAAVFYRSDSVQGTPYNGSMVLMDAGARAEVWARFDPERSPVLTREAGLEGTDQAWMAYVMGAGEAVWTAEDGVMHFVRDCVPDLPAAARIVFFPGVQKAHMPNARRHAPWLNAYPTEP